MKTRTTLRFLFMQYKRLISKIRNYVKYQDDYAIKITSQVALYKGLRSVGDCVTIVSETEMFSATITKKKQEVIGYVKNRDCMV